MTTSLRMITLAGLATGIVFSCSCRSAAGLANAAYRTASTAPASAVQTVGRFATTAPSSLAATASRTLKTIGRTAAYQSGAY